MHVVPVPLPDAPSCARVCARVCVRGQVVVLLGTVLVNETCA